MYDSEGVMRGLLPQGNLMWVPLSDLKVGKRNLSDTYWVVSASDEAIKCVLCKGKKRETCLSVRTLRNNIYCGHGQSSEYGDLFFARNVPQPCPKLSSIDC